MRSIGRIFMIILLSMMAGCCTKKLENCQNLNADDPKIIKFANIIARDFRDLTLYDRPKVIKSSDHWSVLYERKPDDKGMAPLGHFGVTINYKTCERKFLPGS